MRYVFDTARAIAQYLRKDQLVVLESTTYPGTTDQDVRAILEKGGLKAGTDFHLAFSPEREDPNNKDFGLSSIPKVVGGYTPECLAAAMAMYGAIVSRTVPVSSPRVAAPGTNHQRLDIGSHAMVEVVQPMKNGLHFHETKRPDSIIL